MISGNNRVEVLSVASGVTASLTGLTISSGWASQGGGLSIDGGEVSLTNVSVINNQAVGAAGAAGADGGGSSVGGTGGNGGSGLGGGVYLAAGSLTLNGDLIASNLGEVVPEGPAVRGHQAARRRRWIGGRRRYLRGRWHPFPQQRRSRIESSHRWRWRERRHRLRRALRKSPMARLRREVTVAMPVLEAQARVAGCISRPEM